MTRKHWGVTAFRVKYSLNNIPFEVDEVTVEKIGTKYITTLDGLYMVDTGRPHMQSHGVYYMLFPTREAADNYVKHEQAYNGVKGYLNYYGEEKARRMSTMQLERLYGLFGEVK